MLTQTTLTDDSGAIFSDDQQYRYRLWRQIGPVLSATCAYVLLNPSTADHEKNDPTVERCCRRAMKAGFGRVEILNIFAYRSTDPSVLYTLDDPVGTENDAAIIEVVRDAELVICGWGTHGKLLGRGQQVLALLKNEGIRPFALAVNRDRSPCHPLYQKYSVIPVEFK